MLTSKRDLPRIGPRLKLRDLRILMTVAECGTMRNAAEQLAVSQPVVSKTISDIEHAVGVRLFDRSQRGVVPTAYGRALIKRGIVIFDEMTQGLREIEFLSDPASGEVCVGATAPITAAIVAPAIARLTREYPRMRFKVVAADSLPLFARLEARTVDLVISRIVDRVPDQYNVEVLFHDEIKVVTGRKNPLARRRNIALVDLLNEPWILAPPDSYLGCLQAAAFRASGLEPPPITVEASALSVRNELLARNRFLSIVVGFSIVLPRPHRELVALPVKLNVAREPVSTITLKNRSLSPAAQTFIAHVRELTKPLAKAW